LADLGDGAGAEEPDEGGSLARQLGLLFKHEDHGEDDSVVVVSQERVCVRVRLRIEAVDQESELLTCEDHVLLQ